MAHSATSTMLEKVTDRDEYCAGLQAYTVRHLDKPVPTGNDIDQFKMVNVTSGFNMFPRALPNW